ncbi:uncharacterized protein E0L32_006559 [Thyridium curvatum]|uniref:Uncharacterized protein n=1 Tax=Thyridium curvatum TaxID=1093900 RepID=A0A507AZQ4_9PEZI|nr:uncharacterized protein E0L32_006559 [Thyridium curvatum]TPX13133.1 hypothetical protein E0L32_006559 [Thyridium curvatum]
MSVFSLIRRGRQAAKEHKDKQAEKDKKAAEKPPYKHVPTHAAVDALNGAPQTWRADDRPRIIEQHKRRSAMTASGLGMHVAGSMTPVHSGMMPRVNSSLSHVSYPSVYANPMVKVPRAYSYSSMPGWSDRGGEVVYTPMMERPQSAAVKGKTVDRPAMVDSGRASRTSSKAGSPVGSSGDSTSSQDDLEMPAKQSWSQRAPDSRAAAVRVVNSSDQPHRLHPSRRVSDPPAAVVHSPQPQARSTYYPPSSSRPSAPRTATAPTASPMTGAGIPPVPALPPMNFSSPSRMSRPGSASSHRISSGFGLPNSSTSSSTTAADIDPAYIAEPFPDFDTMPRAVSDDSSVPPMGMAISTTATIDAASSVAAAATASTRVDAIDFSAPRALVNEAPAQAAKEPRPVAVTTTALPAPPADLHDATSAPVQTAPPVTPAAPPRASKLSKAHGGGGARLTKKNRWSLRGSSKPAAVAV